MATTNETISDIISGPDKLLFKKARGALVKIARDIISEPDPKSADYPVRSHRAERVMSNPDLALPRVRVELSQVQTIRDKYETDDHTDAQVKNVIDNNFWRIVRHTLVG